MKLAYSLKEAAEMVGLSVDTLRSEIKRTDEKRLRAKQRSGRYVVTEAELRDWLDRLDDT